MNIKRSTRFDGVDFVFLKDEFNSILCTLKAFSKFSDVGEPTDTTTYFLNKVNHLIDVFENYSYFELNGDFSVHARLGWNECNLLFEIIVSELKNGNETDFFDILSNKENARIWKSRDS